MEPKNKSRMGLGFLIGMLGAYILVEILVRFGYWVGLYELTSSKSMNYLISIFSGLITGVLTVYVSKERQLRILLFVVTTLLIMDIIAVLSSVELSTSRMINRTLIDFSVLAGGLLTYKLLAIKKKII